MKPSDIFGVVVRTIGLLLIMGSMWAVFWAFVIILFGGPGSFVGMIIGSIPSLFVGVWFLGGAKAIIRIAYPDEFDKGE